MKYSLNRLFLLVTGFAVALWMLLGLYRGLTHVEFGENQASVSWLPKSATNISYYRSYSFTAYEFEIPEADFVKWSYWKLSPIDKSVRVPRYCLRRGNVPYASKAAIVGKGLTYTHRQANHGGVIVAYDRDLGKAFIWTAPR